MIDSENLKAGDLIKIGNRDIVLKEDEIGNIYATLDGFTLTPALLIAWADYLITQKHD